MNVRILNDRTIPALLIVVFVLSGFSGLIYQSIWTHYLKLFLGHAAYAQSLVLVTFMGGLALGSWLAAQLTRSSRSLLLWYALAEALVGVYALLFHDIFVAALALMFDHIVPALDSVAMIVAVKWGLALALILPPSVLLGTTFPLMAEGLIRRRPQQRGRLLALLYFSNSFGAAVGVLVSGFVLIKMLGLPGTVITAGILNLLVAGAVLLVLALAQSSETPLPSVPPSAADRHKLGDVQLLLLACAGLTGLASFIYELVWVRMLNMVLGSATHSFELMLASFILGLALGGWWIRNRIDQHTMPLRQLAWIQLLMGLFAALTVVFYNGLFDVMAFLLSALDKTDQGYVLFKIGSMSLAMLFMLPATICAGMTLPLITNSLLRYGYDERAVGHVYAVNTLGAIVGVILAAMILIPTLGLRHTLLLGAAIDIALAVWLMARASSGVVSRWPQGFALVGLLCLGLVQQLFPFDTWRMSSSVYRVGSMLHEDIEIVFHRDGRSATVSVRENKKEGSRKLSIATNGKTDASISVGATRAVGDEQTQIALAAVSMAVRPGARDVAVIGFGSGLTTHILLGNPAIERVDTIEIEPVIVEGARLFGASVERAFNDPRSHIYFDDAKSFFSAQRRHYDIVVAEPSNPWVSGVAGLFSREHYRQMKRHLRPGGVYLQWLQLYEFDLSLAVSVLKAFSLEFSDYALYVGADSDLLIVGVAEGELPLLDARFVDTPALQQELQRAGMTNLAEFQSRLIATKSMLDPFLVVTAEPANSDYFPFLDQHAEQARFKNSEALELTSLKRIWLLSNPDKQRQVLTQLNSDALTSLANKNREAKFLRTLLQSNLQLPGGKDSKLPLIAYENAVSVSRLLYRCNPHVVEASWLGDAVWLSDTTSIYGPSGLITPFWQALLDSPCFAKLPGQVQSAFRFFRAASERDDIDILRQGGLLIDYDFEVPGFWNYRVLHMLAAFHRLNRPLDAAKFLSKLADKSELRLDSRVLAAHLVTRAKELAKDHPVVLRAAG